MSLAIVVALAGCSRRGSVAADASATSVADTPRVAPEDETYFADLPGVEGFERLTPEMQAAVAARANRARCDCGCFGHSVNACLHQQEECDVAIEAASRFVEEAALAERLAGTTPVVEPAPAPAAGGSVEPEVVPEGTAATAPEGPSRGAGSSVPEDAPDAAASGPSGPAAGASATAPAASPGESGPPGADEPVPDGEEAPPVAPVPGPPAPPRP